MEPSKNDLFSQLNLEASVDRDGVVYRFDARVLEQGNWGNDSTSSWFICALVSAAKAQMGEQLGRYATLQLCAEILKTTLDQLEQTLEWNAQYLAWHDGGSPSECHVWP